MNVSRLVLPWLLILFAVAASGEGPAKPRRLAIVDRAIEHHGGEIYRHSETELDLCSKSGCFHVVARVDGDRWAYTVSGRSGDSQLQVHSAHDALAVRRNGGVEVVAADREQRFRDWAMARVYFCFLPFRLNDPSVIQQDLGLVDWNGRRLHKIMKQESLRAPYIKNFRIGRKLILFAHSNSHVLPSTIILVTAIPLTPWAIKKLYTELFGR